MKTVTIALKEDTYEAGQSYARQHHVSLDTLLLRLLEQTVHKRTQAISWKRFFAAADRALYKAKRLGRNQSVAGGE